MVSLHVAVRRKGEATQMLEKKLALLEQWIREGVPLLLMEDGTPVLDHDGERQLDYFPKSIASLADWDGTQNCKNTRDMFELALSRTGRMTIGKPYHAELKEALQKKIKELNICARKQSEALNKKTVISSLLERQSHAEALIKQQNKEIAEFQVKRRGLELRYNKKAKSLQGAKLEHQRVVKRLEERIAELTAKLKKVTPLRLQK